jgi:hypothetical protein
MVVEAAEPEPEPAALSHAVIVSRALSVSPASSRPPKPCARSLTGPACGSTGPRGSSPCSDAVHSPKVEQLTAQALARPAGLPVLWRGGGYGDGTAAESVELLMAAHRLGRQVGGITRRRGLSRLSRPSLRGLPAVSPRPSSTQEVLPRETPACEPPALRSPGPCPSPSPAGPKGLEHLFGHSAGSFEVGVESHMLPGATAPRARVAVGQG